MNGYEFTRFESDFTSKVKARSYDAGTIAFLIKYREKKPVVWEEESDYKDAHHWFIETTMSCTTDEAINWMQYYMENAIAYGIQTKNLDWRTKFLAAWDIFNSLCKTKRRTAM